MRFASTLLPIAVTALAITALAAPTALGAIEVKTEPDATSKHCAAVSPSGHTVSGGCGTHAAYSAAIQLIAHNQMHSSETLLAFCFSELELRVAESGEGYVYDQTLEDSAPNSCPIEPCKENGTGTKEMWPFHIKDIGLSEVFEVVTCVQAKGAGVEGIGCQLHIPIAKIGHGYSVSATPGDVGCSGVGDEREMSGAWTIENSGEGTHSSIEIVNT